MTPEEAAKIVGVVAGAGQHAYIYTQTYENWHYSGGKVEHNEPRHEWQISCAYLAVSDGETNNHDRYEEVRVEGKNLSEMVPKWIERWQARRALVPEWKPGDPPNYVAPDPYDDHK